MTYTIADYALALVAALGSDTVFSADDDPASPLSRAAAAQPGLKVVLSPHERGAVAEAGDYAVTAEFERPGFVLARAGSGFDEAVDALLAAREEGVPLIVFASRTESEPAHPFAALMLGRQTPPFEALITPCVKRFLRLSRDTFREELLPTLAEALTAPMGPVLIEMSLDVRDAPVEFDAEMIEEDAAWVRAITLEDPEADEAV